MSAFPQARLVAVAECGTHAVFDATIGPCRTSERELANNLIDRLTPGVLLLADRGFYGFDMWTRTGASSADLLWRAKSTPSPRHLETLGDGSWLARIIPTSGKDRQHRTPLLVRVIDYHLDDGRGEPRAVPVVDHEPQPEEAAAEDLALAYAQRWEVENTFDELKTHQRGSRKVLRSKSPPLVYQEIWGHLCCHYAIRTLMLDSATAGGHDPDRVSFVAALRIARRSLSHSHFPLMTTLKSRDYGTWVSRNYCDGSTLYADYVPTLRWSNGRSSSGLPNMHAINTIRSPLSRRRLPS